MKIKINKKDSRLSIFRVPRRVNRFNMAMFNLYWHGLYVSLGDWTAVVNYLNDKHIKWEEL